VGVGERERVHIGICLRVPAYSHPYSRICSGESTRIVTGMDTKVHVLPTSTARKLKLSLKYIDSVL